MAKKQFACGFLLVTLLAGCADSHKIIRQNTPPAASLSPSSTFYIGVSRDGLYGDEPYPGSGRTLSQVILSSLAKEVRRAEVADTVESYDDALKTARTRKYDYLVFPTILHWENRATEWNGIPDRVKVKIDVVKAEGDTLFDSVIIEGKSGLATFGGDQPQDLLPEPVEEVVSGLFKAPGQRVPDQAR